MLVFLIFSTVPELVINESEAVAYLTDPSRAVVPYGPHLENKGTQPMEIEAFEVEEEEFPTQGFCWASILRIWLG